MIKMKSAHAAVTALDNIDLICMMSPLVRFDMGRSIVSSVSRSLVTMKIVVTSAPPPPFPFLSVLDFVPSETSSTILV